MITTEQYIETHRDTASRADWLASLSQAAQLVLDGECLPSREERSLLASRLMSVCTFLSVDLSRASTALSDQAEKEEWGSQHAKKLGGAA